MSVYSIFHSVDKALIQPGLEKGFVYLKKCALNKGSVYTLFHSVTLFRYLKCTNVSHGRTFTDNEDN